jgi:uncharacterized sulfatase
MESFRGRRSAAVLALLAAVSASACRAPDAPEGAGSTPPAGAGRPNILWITCEDMSPDLGCYGDAYAATPHLDRFAAQGVRYTHAFATAPVCSPARFALLTGLYAASAGAHNLRSSFPVPEAVTGFPSLLRHAGYYCTNNVKTDYNTSGEPALVAACWDDCSARAHWRDRPPGRPFFSVFNAMETHQSRTFESFIPELEKRLAPAERHDPAKAPLPPYYPDTPAARATVARCYDWITVMDRDHVGRLLRELEEDGLADDTIVFFYSDGGRGMPRGKRTLYDSGLRVPLLVCFPPRYRAWAPAGPGGTCDRLVSFVDFGPTVLSLAGVPVPALSHGIPFLGPDSGPPRDCVFGARDRVDEAFDLVRSVRDARYLYIRNFMPHLSHNQPEGFSDQLALRREITLLAAEGRLDPVQMAYAGPRKPPEELYDTEADPHQVRNLAALPKHHEALERMRGRLRLRAWMIETHDLGFFPEPELACRTAGTTPFEWAQKATPGSLAVIREAAEGVGRTDALDRQAGLLGHADPAVRYWAAVGLAAQGAAAAPARGALERALGDACATVRIEAAGALTRLDGDDKSREPALEMLARSLKDVSLDVRLHAARTLQLLGAKARPVLPEMKKALAEASAKEKDAHQNMYIRFALEAAIKALE